MAIQSFTLGFPGLFFFFSVYSADFSNMLQTIIGLFRSEFLTLTQHGERFLFPQEQLLKGLPWKEKLFSLPPMLLLPESLAREEFPLVTVIPTLHPNTHAHACTHIYTLQLGTCFYKSAVLKVLF